MSASHFSLELYFVKRSGDPLHPRHRVLAKGNTRLVAAHQNRLHVGGASQHAEERYSKEGLRSRGQRPESVANLVVQSLDIPRVAHVSQPPVDVELCVLTGDVFVR